jgi:phytanoyl-CoA hydroxylase
MPVRHFSDFGGLWTDRLDAETILAERVASGAVADDDALLVQSWMRDGFLVLPGAVPREWCDDVRRDVTAAWHDGDERIRMVRSDDGRVEPLAPGSPTRRTRGVDLYWHLASARRVLFAPTVTRVLRLLLDEPPLLFQSLSFEQGSEQGWHRDTAFVVVDAPLELVAAWVALEDVVEGSGELQYVPGSHRLPEFKFSGSSKHWNPDRDGQVQIGEFHQHLVADAARLGLEATTFLPRQGDVFLWSADLVHGGLPIRDPESTRRSLVGHYCPLTRRPHFFSHSPDHAVVVPHGDGGYASAYYLDEPAPTAPPEPEPEPPESAPAAPPASPSRFQRFRRRRQAEPGAATPVS